MQMCITASRFWTPAVLVMTVLEEVAVLIRRRPSEAIGDYTADLRSHALLHLCNSCLESMMSSHWNLILNMAKANVWDQ
jgi:hypothetical protein